MEKGTRIGELVRQRRTRFSSTRGGRKFEATTKPYRAARTLPLLAWPSASFLERITWGRERKGEPGEGCILDFAAYTTIITDIFVIPGIRWRL